MNYNIKTALATGIAAAYLAGCSAIPQRADYKVDNQFQGNLAQATAHYAQQETALDAAQSKREMVCLEKLAGNKYENPTQLYQGLALCEQDERNKDKIVYGFLSGAIDLSKLWLIYEGIDSKTSSSSSSSNPPGNGGNGGGGGLEDVITGGGSSGTGGSVINP